MLQLGDGSSWLIPVAKELDSDMLLRDDGTWRFQIQRQFHAFWVEYLAWLQRLGTAGEGTKFDYGEAASFVVSGLRVNYRLTPEVASRLALFTTRNVFDAVLSITGIDLGRIPTTIAAV